MEYICNNLHICVPKYKTFGFRLCHNRSLKVSYRIVYLVFNLFVLQALQVLRQFAYAFQFLLLFLYLFVGVVFRIGFLFRNLARFYSETFPKITLHALN